MLTLDEIHEGLISVMGNVKGNLKEFQEIMQEIDRDGDGLVAYSEFLSASVNKVKLLTDQNLQIAFGMLDTDKNGTISKNELKEVFDVQSQKDEKLMD